MSAKPGDRPALLIIAGPNGSGKSTAYEQSVVEIDRRSFRIINPDMFAARIGKLERLQPDEANLQAVIRIEQWLETSILAGHTVGVETVLSTGKYRRLVERAKAIGHEFRLIYVMLDTPERNMERVAWRVSQGGHGVPEEKIRARYERSLRQLPWFLAQADEALLYDNSGAQPRLVGKKTANFTRLDEAAPLSLKRALDADR